MIAAAHFYANGMLAWRNILIIVFKPRRKYLIGIIEIQMEMTLAFRGQAVWRHKNNILHTIKYNRNS